MRVWRLPRESDVNLTQGFTGFAITIFHSISVSTLPMSVHGKVTIKYPIVVSLPELEKFTNELAAIGNNLNQIARYFDLAGLQSQAMRERINSCITAIMEMRKRYWIWHGIFKVFLKHLSSKSSYYSNRWQSEILACYSLTSLGNILILNKIAAS